MNLFLLIINLIDSSYKIIFVYIWNVEIHLKLNNFVDFITIKIYISFL